MIRRLRKLNNRGDTIVEVLIVLAVLSLALSISYATANKGLQQSRNAQEHSQALGIINGQIELLRSAFSKGAGGQIEAQGGPSGGPFCLSAPVPPNSVNIHPLTNAASVSFNEDIASDVLNQTPPYPADCIQDDLYNTSIVPRGNGIYDFRVRWEGLGSLGRQQEELTYKIGNVTAAITGGYTDPEIPPPSAPSLLALSLTANGSNDLITVSSEDLFRLEWLTSPDADNCTASGDWSGSKPGSGSASVRIIPPTSDLHELTNLPEDDVAGGSPGDIINLSGVAGSTFTFILTCSKPGLGDTTATVSVKVQDYTPALATFYRLYHGSNNFYNHFYSTDRTEGTPTYVLQGNVGAVDTRHGPGEIPLYQFWGDAITDHFYTTDPQERERVAADPTYSYSGIVGYIKPYPGSGECPSGTHKLYRMYSSYLTDHFYTDNLDEYNRGTDLAWPQPVTGFGGRSPGPGSESIYRPTIVGPPPLQILSLAPWYNYPEGIIGCIFNTPTERIDPIPTGTD